MFSLRGLLFLKKYDDWSNKSKIRQLGSQARSVWQKDVSSSRKKFY